MKTIIADRTGQFWIHVIIEGQRPKELGPYNSYAKAEAALKRKPKKTRRKQNKTPNKHGHTGHDVLSDYTFTVTNNAIYKDNKKPHNEAVIRIDSLIIRRTTLLKYIASLVS